MDRNIDKLIRLNKFIAESGLTSRRKADDLIREGSVQINGHTVKELGVRVQPGKDRVTVDGKLIRPANQQLYVAFYKPENVLTSMSDPHGRPTVKDYMEELPVRVYPVGRLDWDTEGLLLLTNDGEFAQKIAHPRAAIPKTYLAKLDGVPTREQLDKLLRGVSIPGGKASALHVSRVPLGTSQQYAWYKIIINEGRNRQVRKMFEKIGFDVKKLKRVAIGQLEIGHLKKGQYVFLGPKGIEEALSGTWEGQTKKFRSDGRPSRPGNRPGRRPSSRTKRSR